MIARLERPQMLLVNEFFRERLVDFTTAVFVCIAPQSTITMTVVAPAWIVEDWIQAESFNRHARSGSGSRFLAHVTQPRRTRVAFNASLGDEYRPAITFVDLLQHFPDRPVQRMRRR